MTSEELLVERLIRRIDQANTYFLKKIGSSIKQIRNLTPTQAHELVQILKYGGSYEDIIKKIAQYTNLNISEIDEIFGKYAKQDREFYKQFYEYRNIPFEESSALRMQREALTRIVKNEMYNFTRSNVLGYTIDGKFYGLRDTYNKLLDEALLNVGQGKETFDSAMTRILKDIGGSGLRTLVYDSTYIDKNGVKRNRTRRLDSAIRMQLKSRLRELHNENQKIIGEEIGADGVEISVHENPAIDHEKAQGRQFSNKEYKKLQKGEEATDNTGFKVSLDHDHKNGYRPISELNCYHYVFSIVLGVSKPRYSEKQLQDIIDKNDKGFEFEGKHYTNYEGTQLQRNLERAIREQKDMQILAKASGNQELINQSQSKITQLTNKYKKLNEVSGLPTKMKRLSVSGYRRTKQVDNNPPKPIVNAPQRVVQDHKKFNFEEYEEKLKGKGIRLNSNLKDIDQDLLERNIKHLDYLSDKYNVGDRQYIKIYKGTGNRNAIATTYYSDNRISLSPKYFNNKQSLIDSEIRSQKYNWHNKVEEKNLDLYTITHEYGHAIENNYARKYIKTHHKINTDERRLDYTLKEDRLRKEIDKDIRDSLFNEIRKEEKITITEIKNKYFSGYGKSKTHYEWFAETFAQMILGEETPLTKAMTNWLERNYK